MGPDGLRPPNWLPSYLDMFSPCDRCPPRSLSLSLSEQHKKLVAMCRTTDEEAAVLDVFIDSGYNMQEALKTLHRLRRVNKAYYRNRKRRGKVLPQEVQHEPTIEPTEELDLSMLCPRHRCIVQLKMDGWGIAEIAAKLRCDRGTIRRELGRIAKIILREYGN